MLSAVAATGGRVVAAVAASARDGRGRTSRRTLPAPAPTTHDRRPPAGHTAPGDGTWRVPPSAWPSGSAWRTARAAGRRSAGAAAPTASARLPARRLDRDEPATTSPTTVGAEQGCRRRRSRVTSRRSSPRSEPGAEIVEDAGCGGHRCSPRPRSRAGRTFAPRPRRRAGVTPCDGAPRSLAAAAAQPLRRAGGPAHVQRPWTRSTPRRRRDGRRRTAAVRRPAGPASPRWRWRSGPRRTVGWTTTARSPASMASAATCGAAWPTLRQGTCHVASATDTGSRARQAIVGRRRPTPVARRSARARRRFSSAAPGVRVDHARRRDHLRVHIIDITSSIVPSAVDHERSTCAGRTPAAEPSRADVAGRSRHARRRAHDPSARSPGAASRPVRHRPNRSRVGEALRATAALRTLGTSVVAGARDFYDEADTRSSACGTPTHVVDRGAR